MNISIVIPSFYPATVYGGTIFASLNSARILKTIGHTVKVSTTNTNMNGRLSVPSGRFIELEKNIFVKYYNETIVDKLSLSLILNVWKDIRHAELIHIQAIFNTPIPAALIYSKLFKKPVILSPHGVLGDWVMSHGSRFKKFWLKCLIKPFSRYVYWHATSQQEKEEILCHFPHARVFVIPNTINLEEYKGHAELSRVAFMSLYAGVQIEKVGKIIVSMGRLQKKKGFDILIKAFEKVNKQVKDSFLLIAGEDEGEKTLLTDLIIELQLEGKVFFTGNLEGKKKVDFLAYADLFVLPSHNENFGIVYAEALASGTPIVASTQTPWEEVEQVGCGKWVANTEEETAEAILEMLEKDKAGMSEGMNKLLYKYSKESVSKEWENLIELIKQENE